MSGNEWKWNIRNKFLPGDLLSPNNVKIKSAYLKHIRWQFSYCFSKIYKQIIVSEKQYYQSRKRYTVVGNFLHNVKQSKHMFSWMITKA
jgi:hypothetical protein